MILIYLLGCFLLEFIVFKVGCLQPAPYPEDFLESFSFKEDYDRYKMTLGRASSIRQRPFQGYVNIDNKFVCGCELVCVADTDIQVVLTAGHCLIG